MGNKKFFFMSRIKIRVIPNAKQSEIVGLENGAWKIRLKAPAIEGKANDELVRFLAETCKCSKSEISIVKGMGSREKMVEIPGYVEFPNTH